MSRRNCDSIRGKLSFVPSLHPYGTRIAACTLLLIGALLTASCGFLGQSAEGQSQGLTLSGTFPGGVAHQTYNAVLTVSGGNAPYQFAVKSGSLPPGVNLNSLTGSVSGTPTAAGSYAFQVGVVDIPGPNQGSQNFAISIAPADGGGGIRVTVSPASANVVSNQTQTFTATVTGTENTAVTWSASAGSITNSGVYTAPAVGAATTVWITANSVADSKKQGLATVVVEPPTDNALAITTTSLPDGHTGNVYDAGFTATGGQQPYSWSVSNGNIPPGLTLTQNDGQLTGIPSAAGTYNFTVTVKDAYTQAGKSFALNIAEGGNFDGPAELPRVTVPSSLGDTPAPGTIITVNAGGDLQAALNNAHCGDTIDLQAGATFTGTFDFPAKSCDDNHWIVVRTSAPDSALPAEGQRMTPCYAGVTSLPGRPQYTCLNPSNVLAKLQLPGLSTSLITFLSGANHYRLLGLEMTRPAGGKGAPTLVNLDQTATADHIVLDRVWLHGTAHDDTRVGFLLKGSNYVAVVDSYLNDFHCTAATGACTDAHAIGGGTGDHQDGPYKIENNFLEASGESIMFGGGGATTTPTDIVVRRNHFFKPIQWMKGQPGFIGGVTGDPFIVKNHLELKNAVRVLLEANLMENSWGGFTQTGRAIVLTPKNQHTKSGAYVCPLCQVTDVTIRYVHIAHAGGGIVFSTGCDLGCQNTQDANNGGQALAGSRFSVHDVVMDDISRNYVGSGTLFELRNGWLKDPLNSVTISHVTGFPDPESHMMSIGNLLSNPPMFGLVFTNNIVLTGKYPIWSTGGGQASCAYQGGPAAKLTSCFATYTFTSNALVASPPAAPPSSWPSGNFFPATPNTVGFTRYQEGGGGDYELKPSSAYKNAGTDGRDLGADIVGLEAALAGIE